MSKKPVKKSVKYDGPMTNGMKFFLAGCVAQLYLMIIDRFYIGGTMDQILFFHTALKGLVGVGLAAAAGGAVLLKKGGEKRRELSWYVLGGGAFVAAASALVLWNMGILSLLTTIVPAVLVIDVLWWLFDREAALSLTVLAAALVVAWVNRRVDAMAVKALSVVFVAAVGALAVLVKQGKVKKLSAGGLFFASCGVAAVGAVAAVVSTTVAYYVMWVLAAAIFCVAVYYTVKQL
ncbi:MAG: hypothetical protein IJE22_00205 [Oscillibacter sp.]|nr:hypothetical protein [Oscillibacter sp.]MBQ2995644.1 hypothetical protein [Oscillibacter sp.]